MAIYDVLGREVALLVDEVLAAGHYTVRWNGRDRSGQRVSSGVYFYRLQAGSYAATKKMVIEQ